MHKGCIWFIFILSFCNPILSSDKEMHRHSSRRHRHHERHSHRSSHQRRQSAVLEECVKKLGVLEDNQKVLNKLYYGLEKEVRSVSDYVNGGLTPYCKRINANIISLTRRVDGIELVIERLEERSKRCGKGSASQRPQTSRD